MKNIFLSVIFFLSAVPVYAYVPEVVIQKSLLDVVTIDDTSLAQTFFGDLDDFPHTYQIVATEPFHLSVHIRVPDIESSTNNLSGIIIKEPEGKGRVQEIARLYAKDGLWESSREWWSGDSYRNGPSFEKDLGPGTYRIEVHTPDNHEKYILTVGSKKELALGYFETVKRMVEVKKFFEKSPIWIIESPLVFVPLSIFGIGCAFVWYRRRIKILKI
jgi:hypothetical protein